MKNILTRIRIPVISTMLVLAVSAPAAASPSGIEVMTINGQQTQNLVRLIEEQVFVAANTHYGSNVVQQAQLQLKQDSLIAHTNELLKSSAQQLPTYKIKVVLAD